MTFFGIAFIAWGLLFSEDNKMIWIIVGILFLLLAGDGRGGLE